MTNKLIAPLLLFFGAIYLYFFRLPRMQIMVEGSNSLLMPKIILISLMIFSFLLVMKIIFNKDSHELKGIVFDKNTRLFLLSLLFCVAYLYLSSIFGYLLLTPFFLFIFIYTLGNKKFWLNGVVSLTLTVIIYFLFIKMLYVPLPKGIGVFKSFSEFLFY